MGLNFNLSNKQTKEILNNIKGVLECLKESIERDSLIYQTDLLIENCSQQPIVEPLNFPTLETENSFKPLREEEVFEFEEFIQYENWTMEDVIGSWSYDTKDFKYLNEYVPAGFTIFKDEGGYYITFHKKKELIYSIYEEGYNRERCYCFYIEGCKFRIEYMKSNQGVYLIPYLNYYTN